MANRGVSDSIRHDLEIVAESEQTNFIELVNLSRLDPSTDFVGADLRGADLRGLDLSEFDFTGANISGALVEGTVFDPQKKPKDIEDADFTATPFGVIWNASDNQNDKQSIPPEMQRIIQDIRDEGIHAESVKLQNLVKRVTGYSDPSSFLNRIGFRRKKFMPAPEWLEDFLVERYSVSSRKFIKKFIEDLANKEIIGIIDQKQCLMKAAVWHEYETKRGDYAAKLGENYKGDRSIYDFLVDLALSDPSFLVRQGAIRNLTPPEDLFDDFRDLAMGIYHNDPDDRVQGAAIAALRYLRKVDTEVFLFMFEVASNMECSYPRGEALLSLEHEIGSNNEIDNIIYQLIDFSINGPTDQGMLAAISIAARLTEGNNEAAIYLFDKFKKIEEDIARFWLFSALVRSHKDSQFIEDEPSEHLAVFA